MPEIIWTALSAERREWCTILERPDGVVVTSRFSGDVGGSYSLNCDAAWNFRSLDLAVAEGTVSARYSDGQWVVDGVARPDLADAREVDISISPLTNTLPIRRLGLDVGEGADIVTAYVDVPALTVTADPQRYTRLSAREYLYESRDSDFRSTLTVDERGVVEEYPGLFTRE